MPITDLNRRQFLKGSGTTAIAGAMGAGITLSAMPTPAMAKEVPYLVNGRYDFDTVYSRLGTNCTKWDGQINKFGPIQVGMGIADLDFRAAPCIGEAMRERLEHENWGYLNWGIGFTDLKEGISNWNRERHGVEVDPDTIEIASGVHPSCRTPVYSLCEASSSSAQTREINKEIVRDKAREARTHTKWRERRERERERESERE